jgi:hypothetical protein
MGELTTFQKLNGNTTWKTVPGLCRMVGQYQMDVKWYSVKVLVGFVWFRRRSSGRIIRTRFHKKWELATWKAKKNRRETV